MTIRPGGKALLSLILVSLIFSSCFSSSARVKKEIPRVLPVPGTAFPEVTALAWSSPDGTPADDRFTAAYADGLIRVWDLFSGRELSAFPSDGAGPELVSTFPVLSTDGTKKLYPAGDGSICLADSATEKELARYYAYRPPAGVDDEWISVVPAGFYNASSGGSSLLEAAAGEKKYSLDQLSSLLFRPDLFYATLKGGEVNAPGTLESLFEDEQAPPVLSLSVEGETEPRELKLKITAQKDGAGTIVLFRQAGTRLVPSGYLDAEKAAEKKYSEKGKTCYELRLETGTTRAVSVFNASNTIESGRSQVDLPGVPLPPPEKNASSRLPALKVLFAGPEEVRENAGVLEKLFSQQSGGDLFSAVEVKNLFGPDFSSAGFGKALEALCSGTGDPDTLIVCLSGKGLADSMGNLGISLGNENVIPAASLLPPLTGVPMNSVLLLLDLAPGDSAISVETALCRFRQRLGPKAILASFYAGEKGGAFIASLIQKLSPDFSTTVVSAAPASGAASASGSGFVEKRYTGAEELLAGFIDKDAGAGQEETNRFSLAFPPLEDFMIADRFADAGEFKFQTMASGMLKIDKVDKDPIPLAFGKTMSRALVPGNYIIDMIYRNGYRETRTVQLRKKQSAWVIFTYTPPLLVGDFSSKLPSLGINTSELNPANYQKINRDAMEGMGMAPWYVAFLGGQKLYEEGNYDKAVAELSRSISLKADNADSYVSRGNALRRKGDLNRAIEDYSRALTLKSGYAEVYNYRGFVYASKGDFNKAIADYTQAVRYKANYADALFNRAYANAKQDNWDAAIADYTQVIKLEPSNAVAYHERGSAWDSKGDKVKAAADFAAAEKIKK